MELINPCSECLVVVCCQESCRAMRDFTMEVLEVAVENPDHPIIDTYNEEQARLIRSTAEWLKGSRQLAKLTNKNKR